MGNGAADAHEEQGSQRWTHHVRSLTKISLGKGLRQSFGVTGCLAGNDGIAKKHWHLHRPVFRPRYAANLARSFALSPITFWL